MADPTTTTTPTTKTQTTEQQSQAVADPTTAIASRDDFQAQLLESICTVAPAEGGAILRLEKSDAVQMLAIYPSLENEKVAPQWLAKAADFVPTVAASGVGHIAPLSKGDDLYGQAPSEFVAVIPIGGPTVKPEVAVFRVRASQTEPVGQIRNRLEMLTRLVALYDLQTSLRERSNNMLRMRSAMEIVAQLTAFQKFRPAAMALCNEVAAKWSAERVSLGILKGRYVKIRAISHTDRFTRKMRLVQDLESVMEECLDQDVEVIHPAGEGATFVSRAAAQSSNRHGPVAIASIPLRRDGEVKGVLTIERDTERPFTRDEIETLRLLGDLCAGSVLYLNENDRWTGAKVAGDARKAVAAMVGPKHTWLKLLVIAITTLLVLGATIDGTHKVESSFVIEPPELSVISAPFNGRLAEVYVEPDDLVSEGDPVAAFDTSELLDQLALEQAQILEHKKEETKARDEGKTADALMAVSRRKKVEAKIDLLNKKIARATLQAPHDGRILSGDLKRHINREYALGDVLFEIAPVDSIEAELSVPEKRIGDIVAEQERRLVASQKEGTPFEPLRGELATTANPGEYIPFVVERIDPVAEVVKQQNIFRVHVQLEPDDEAAFHQLKRGMSGTAKINIDKRPYLEIWTKDLINWVRMQLWI